MSNPQNEAILRRALDYLSQPNANLPDLDHTFDLGWTLHRPGLPQLKGPEGAKQLHDFYWNAFSDFKMIPERMVSDGDWVACHYSMEGKHTGEFQGNSATGKSFRTISMGMFRFRDGKMVEAIANPDRLDMLQQLGIIQGPGQGQRRAA